MKKKLLIAVLALVVAAAGAFFILTRSGGEEEPVMILEEYTPGEYFVTNIEGSNRLLKAALVLIVSSEEELIEELRENLTKQNSLIRDKILFILRTLNEEAIRSNDTIPELRKRILDELNRSLDISNIVEIRFNDFVMQ